MKLAKFCFALTLITLWNPLAMAQHGTAPNGYYPMGFNGDTFTGTVQSVNDESREIQLGYTKGSKTDVFTGVLQDGYSITLQNGTKREIRPSDIPAGRRITVYYMPKTKKMEGKKTKYYEIFKIDFNPRS